MCVSTRANSATGCVQVLRVLRQRKNNHGVKVSTGISEVPDSQHELYCRVPSLKHLYWKVVAKLVRVLGGIYGSQPVQGGNLVTIIKFYTIILFTSDGFLNSTYLHRGPYKPGMQFRHWIDFCIPNWSCLVAEIINIFLYNWLCEVMLEYKC
jgi:hypothetical protein